MSKQGSPHSRLRRIAAFAGVLVTLMAPAWALAQTRTVTPNTDGVLMRSGNGSSWYEIATLKAGQVLKTDGEVDGWLRVEYPSGLNAVVKNDEVEVKGDVATLTRRSRLRALSMTNPVLEESFRFVCDRELAPGTTLKVIGRIKDRAGAEAGYIVQAPDCARGFVLARDMKEAQVEAPAPAPTPVATQPKPADQKPTEPKPTESAPAGGAAPAQPVVAPVTQPTGQPAPSSTGTNPASTSTVAQPPVQPPAQPADQTTPTTTTNEGDPVVPAPAGTTTDAVAPAGASDESVAAPVPVQPPQPTGPTMRQLDRMLQDYLALPAAEAGDPQELIEAYTKYAVEAESKPGGSRLVQLADQRLDVLRLRQQAYRLLPEISALEQKSRDALANYQGTIDRLIANRQYLVAGRLVPSTVYDGGRLPLMYRLVSIDPAINRTIAYIVPSPELQLEQKTGAIVGVLGDGTIEPSSLVQIIRPTVVDVLRAASEATP